MNIDKIQPPVRDMIFDKFGKQYTLKRDKGSTISIYTNSKLDKSQFGNEMRLLEDQTYVSGYGIILQITKKQNYASCTTRTINYGNCGVSRRNRQGDYILS